MNENLSERKRLILSEIIADFVMSGEPVGSLSLSRKGRVGLSAASIRNAMSELETMGFLTHPHTSAGRVPTDKAYRFYIDSLSRPEPLSGDDRRNIEEKFTGSFGIQEALNRSSKIVSGLCRQLSIVMRPNFSDIFFRHIEFIALGKRRLLAVMVSKSGVVINKTFETGEAVAPADLEKINNYLNSILCGLSIREVKRKIMEEMKKEKALYDRLCAKALKLGAAFMEDQQEGDFIVEGAANIIGIPEFADMEKMKRIFRAFEEKSILLDLLDRSIRSGRLSVWIGGETGIEEMEGFSLVTSPYGTAERSIGCIGVLGPKRMDYSRVIPIVDYTARKLSSIIAED